MPIAITGTNTDYLKYMVAPVTSVTPVFKCVFADACDRVRAIQSSRTLPDCLLADLRVDADGNVWIQEYRRPGATTIRWHVVSPGGNRVASIQVPSSLAITDIRGDRVAGVWRDENDVETVRVYMLRR